MPNRFRWVPISAEVNSLDAEIGSNQSFIICRDSHHRAIFANTEPDLADPWLCEMPSNLLDERFFRQWHEGNISLIGQQGGNYESVLGPLPPSSGT